MHQTSRPPARHRIASAVAAAIGALAGLSPGYAALAAAPDAPSISPGRVGAPNPRGTRAGDVHAAPSINPRRTPAPSAVASKPADAPERQPLPAQQTASPTTSIEPLVTLAAPRRHQRRQPPAFHGPAPVQPFRTPPAAARQPFQTATLASWKDGDLPARARSQSVRLTAGETFVDALARAGIARADVNAAAGAIAGAVNLRTLRPGASFDISTVAPNATLFQSFSDDADLRLVSLRYLPDAEHRVVMTRSGDGFATRIEPVELDRRIAAVAGGIEGSLFYSASRAGAPAGAIVDLANMFAYDIDFQRDIFKGDRYEAVFEADYDEDGELTGAGEVLYGELSWRGGRKSKGYYRFQSSAGGSRADYFDRDGSSAKRLLMKTPIDGARLSSGFGTRKHPVLGYRKAHKGVDFAAARGTPIYAAGDGVIERANRYGSYGNYVRIRHSQGYSTAYAHLNGFRRGLKAGMRVEQGDVIGYVGTTGRSTGPHLHYEVLKNGTQINPQNLKIATGVTLTGKDLKTFLAERARIDALRSVATVRRTAAQEPSPAVSDAAATPSQ